MRKTITVKIEKSHWDAALESAWFSSGEELLIHDNKCPIAQALYEKLSTRPHVNGSLVNISGQQYTLDESGSNFVAFFDDHEHGTFPEFPVKVKLTLCQPEKSGK
jgi:hypothetical protein